MTALVGWCCKFCGLGTQREEKPGPGACPERESVAHIWGKAELVLGDDDLRADLQAHVVRRRASLLTELRREAGERFREDDLAEAERAADLAMVDGDSWTTASLSATNEAAAEASKRTFRAWRCDCCGLGVEGSPVPPEGGCGARSGAGHRWCQWWTDEEVADLKETWGVSLGTLTGALGGSLRADAAAQLLRAGVPYLQAVERARSEPESVDPFAEAEGAGEEEPPSALSSEEPAPVQAQPVLFEALAANAPKRRGRPPKSTGAAAVVAVPPAAPSAPSSGISVFASPAIGPREPDDDVGGSDELWSKRRTLRRVDVAIDAVFEVRRDMVGELGGHLLQEALNELYRRRGLVSREVEALGKAAAE